MKRIAITVLAALLIAGCGEASSGYDVAEPRITPKPKICSDYTSARQIERDERAGKLSKADRQWLDMDGDGRYCEERGQTWKGAQAQ
jgi:hypothetical protein